MAQFLLGSVVSPNTSAIQQAESTTQGFLGIPSMTTTQRDAIATPAERMLVYNSTTATYDMYTGAAWVALAGSGPITAQNLTLTGTGGNGYVQMRAQASDPAAPGTDGFVVFPNANSYLAWRIKNGSDTYTRNLIGTITANRSYTLPDYDGQLATLAGPEALSNKTYSGTLLNLTGATDPTVSMLDVTSVQVAAATITNKELTSNVATSTTSAPHGFSVGWIIAVTGVDSTFDGTATLTGVTSNTFTFSRTAADVPSAAATGTATLIHRPLIRVFDPTGAQTLQISSQGHIAIGGGNASQGGPISIVETYADPNGTFTGLNAQPTATLSSNNSASPIVRAFNSAVTLDQGSSNASAAAPGAALGGSFAVTISGASGTVTAATAVRGNMFVSGGGTLTTAYGFYLSAPGTGGGSTIVNIVGLAFPALTGGTNNTYLLLGTNSAPSGNWGIYVTSTNSNSLAGKLGLGRNSTPLATLDAQVSDSGTTTVIETAAFVRNSSGTPAAGLGGDVGYYLKSSTTADTLAARMRWYWNTATHASRKAYAVLSAYDTAERDAIGIGASGSEALLGFYGIATAPIARQLLATGAGHSVDDVITALQNLGLVKQS